MASNLMSVISGFDSVPKALKSVVLTLGNFDGVHLGHRHLFERVRLQASKEHRPTLAVTFDPHPSRVLRPEQPVLRLFPVAETYRQILAAGIDHVLVVPFTLERSHQSAAEFLAELQKHLAPSGVVVGHDFAFGHEREGSFAMLQAYGAKQGWHVEKIGPVLREGEVVSSSLLRKLLAQGEIEKLNGFLGRTYALSGVVTPGEGRGEGLGFATANVAVENEILPAAGVYVTEFLLDDRRLPSVTNVGYKPTFHAHHALTIETHVLGIKERFYDRQVHVGFHKRLRAELKFSNAHELIKQIERDVAETKEFFGL
jgi:riboflavin kinase / FMN adenylyltransferase